MVDAGEDVEQRPRRRRVEADAVGRQRRHAERRRQADERLVVALLVAAKVPLQLDVDAAAAEDADQPIEQAADAVAAAVERGAPGERDQPGVQPSSSSSVSAPSPFGARSFMRVTSRQRFR